MDKERIEDEINNVLNSHNVDPVSSDLIGEIFNDVDYLMMHLHHDLFYAQNSRKYIQVLGDDVCKKIKNVLIEFNNKDIDYDNNIVKFYNSYFDVYFDLIGRIDSYSEAIFRQLHHFSIIGNSSLFLSFNDTLDHDIEINKKITESKNPLYRGIHLEIKLSHKLRNNLIGNGHLLKIMVPVIYEIYINNDEMSGNRNETILRILDEKCFLKSREAYISKEVARCNANQEIKNTLLELYAILFENPIDSWKNILNVKSGNHSEDFAKIERVMGMLQAVAMSSFFSSDTFISFIPGQSKITNGFYSGIAIGINNTKVFSEAERNGYFYFANNFVKLLDNNVTHDEKERNIIFTDEKCRYWKILKEKLNSVEYIQNINDKAALQVLWALADELYDSKHEGKDLTFRVIIGRDDYLREYFIPEHYIENNKQSSYDDLWSINLKNVYTIKNQIYLLISLIEANYAFLQEPNKFLCFSVSDDAIRAKYIGSINKRISKFIKGGDAINIFSRTVRLESIGETIKNVFFANIDKENTSLYNKGKLLACYSERDQNWIEADAVRKLHSTYNKLKIGNEFIAISNDEVSEFLEKEIFDIIRVISQTSGLGTTLIFGDYQELKKYTSQTAQIIEVIPNWKFDEINEFNKKSLFDLAIKDGALIFDTTEKKIYPRHFTTVFANERPINPLEWNPDSQKPIDDTSSALTLWNRWKDKNDRYYWEDWGKWFRWGTRHTSAATLAYLGKGKFKVFTVSSDYSVHYFDGYKIYCLSNK